MSTYAILGATGNCGKALVQNLLQSPSNTIHAYCRNRTKLYNVLPEVIDSKQVKIFDGSVHDVSLIADCIRGTQAVFLVVTCNDNLPGCSLAQDTARIVVEALHRLRAEEGITNFKVPKLVLLSSATIDDHLAHDMPWWFRPVMLKAASFVYDDLRVAETFLRQQSDWLQTIFIKPGGLAVDVAQGHELSFDDEESFISYLDLSAGMIEAVRDESGKYVGRNVGVVHKVRGTSAKFPKGTPMVIITGLLRHYFPWLHRYLPMYG
ncbi:putative NAD-dependent epimerase/dehydratase [Cryphonectria parasitica EP155]|uniref:NAD-dependent epimerase/dehydratase n=1 Tax=Cryphonectria parasitica (strain ATCC 38755 / EP155) TaxID=660469 RepID=A0A9P4XY31_CRYP1|nr:putative NAD-dependent epimerase/dehydratase [Cryphonectria parasitica EP155]KAF3763001.1 putative NAD-dependent epimerase/dehydratase [Cryphonectria parasitica EP155]